ncbi:MAG TPA: arginase family protein [Streptosporangiaceae bacterium]|nr:arginase family protein [Streptosporangiaceae bacterium]
MPQDRYGVRDLAAPWYAGSASFLRAPWVPPAAVPAGDVAIVGMPVDQFATSVGHTGMRLGPRRIREASLFLAGYHGIQADAGISDFGSGVIWTWPARLPLVDTGDVPIIPGDVPAQVAAAADHIAAASKASSLTITLGGDHFVAYPATLGVVTALRERRPGARLAYLHIDSHTDFVDFHHQTGRMHHGSAARRVSEIPELTRMAWFGVNAMTQPNQVAVMYDRGFRVATASYVETVGPADAMNRVLDYLLDGTDALYVSIDIDVVNSSDAPATSAPGFRGISARALIEALDVVARVPGLIGLDLCEVNPEFDLSGRTEQLAVDALLSVIQHRVFERVGELPAEQLAAVLFTPDAR